jgi:protein-arginine kinase activator protein McsA
MDDEFKDMINEGFYPEERIVEVPITEDTLRAMDINTLEGLLEVQIEQENFETAAIIRDILKEIKNEQSY